MPDAGVDSAGPIVDGSHPSDGTAGDSSPNGGDATADAPSTDDASMDGMSPEDGGDGATPADGGEESGPPADSGIDAADAGDAAPNTPSISVLTQRYDIARTGQNIAETVLTPANVNVGEFGKLYCRSVDDQIYTQPLIVAQVPVAGVGTRDVVYVATMNDTVYAFDATDTMATTPLWSRSFLTAGEVPVQASDMLNACGSMYSDISGNIGVLSTPVIDPTTSTMYLVARTKPSGGGAGVGPFYERFHAIDIRDGSEKAGSPTLITASVMNQAGATVTFDPWKNNQRASLLLSNGVVYVAFSSHCDWGPYNGWVLGYDATTFQQVVTYNVTPDGQQGGIWSSPAADALGSIYVSTGNGTVGLGTDPTNTNDRGMSMLRLTRSGSTLDVASWFTPHDYVALNNADMDLGSGGVMLVPDTNLAVFGGKSSILYASDRTNLGGLTTGRTDNPSVQEAPLNAMHIHGTPTYWKSPAGPLVYVWAEYDHLKSFSIDPASSTLNPVFTAESPQPAPNGMPGGMLTISANGSTDGTGIIWANVPLSGDANQMVVPGELHAFDAENIGVELWNTTQNAARDTPGNFAKFASPTVANGFVYLPTFSSQLCVYGLLPNVTPLAAPTGLTVSAPTNTTANLQWVSHSTTETGFAVERREGNGGFTPIANTAAGATTFADGNAQPFASYTYRVRALGTPAPSAYSNYASIVMNMGPPAARIVVTGAGRTITLGSGTPSSTTNTDFGADILNTMTSEIYTIQNIGNAALNVTLPVTISGAGAAAYAITAAPAATVPVSATTNFRVTFTPTAAGSAPATIGIATNDPDQPLFTFAIGGIGLGDPLGWWKLNETTGTVAADSSGDGNNGTTLGVTWTTTAKGPAGSFDGAMSYITVPENASLDPYAITVASWINPIDWMGNRRILQKGANDDQYRLLAETGVFKFDLAGVGTLTTTLPTVNVWTHVAGTYDGTTMKLYVNGTLATSVAATNPLNATTDPFIIGSKGPAGTAGDHFHGLLYDVRLYGRALSAAEITTLAH